MIRAGALASPDEVARFLREAEAAANLQHPHIVAIHEVGEHDGQRYFSMDLVNGRDLGAFVAEGPLAPQRAARYVKIIAEAIHFAHQRGTLHRDLKPQNVLIDAADQPRITDFGLAKITKDDSQRTQSGVIMGSPSYMPPEQAAGRTGDIGPASDVYSMGAMLYELLTGRPPFRGTTAMATLRDVMESEPATPRRLKADIPPDLETVCLKCLEKSPVARYPTARALAEELDRFLKGEPIVARPASAVRKVVSWARRHPGALAALAALVIITLAFGVLYLIEENAFLRAQQANPSLRRFPFLHIQSTMVWFEINAVGVFAGFFTFLAVRARARGLSFGQWVGPAIHARTQPLDQRTRIFAIGASLTLIGCAVMLLVATIRAFVWDGQAELVPLLFAYFSIYFALATLGLVIRDYRLVHYGMSSAQLTAEQIEPIRRAMEDWDVLAAVSLYQKALPDAGLLDANQYVLGLADSLRAQHPGKFVEPPLSLATLNWEAMGSCVLVEAVCLGVLWYQSPPVCPAWAVSQFTYTCLLVMVLLPLTRAKGFWKRLRLIVPGAAAMILSEAIAPHLVEASSRSAGSYLCGIVCGFFLGVYAVTPRRRKKTEISATD
jgi:hypothetical protein